MGSYHKDSRNENVEFDYNNLRITGPTSFSSSGTVNFNGIVTGFTWPRSVVYNYGTQAYIGGAGEVDLVPSAPTLSDNFFTSVGPVLTLSNYIQFDPLTGVHTIVKRGYHEFFTQCRIIGGIATGESILRMWWKIDNAAVSFTEMASHHVAPGGSLSNNILMLNSSFSKLMNAGNQFKITYESTQTASVSPSITVTKFTEH